MKTETWNIVSQQDQYICFLSSLPLLPGRVWSLGPYLSSLYSELTLYHWCGLAYPYHWRGFAGAKKKTIVGLILFNPLCRIGSVVTWITNE